MDEPEAAENNGKETIRSKGNGDLQEWTVLCSTFAEYMASFSRAAKHNDHLNSFAVDIIHLLTTLIIQYLCRKVKLLWAPACGRRTSLFVAVEAYAIMRNEN